MPKKKKKGIVRISSSDLASQPGGWVEMCGYLKTKHWPWIRSLNWADLAKEDITSEEHEATLSRAYELLSRLVLDWNWKDPDGDPYPKPADNPSVFAEIALDEFTWLIGEYNKIVGKQTTIPKQNDTP